MSTWPVCGLTWRTGQPDWCPRGCVIVLGERHALYIGWVLGLAHLRGLPMRPVLDQDGAYTDRIRLDLSNKAAVELVVPEPPEDWP